MKHTSTFLLLMVLLLLAEVPVLAQKNDRKIYTANVGNDKPSPTTKREKDEVIFQAKSKINDFLKTLQTLTFNDLTASERDSVVQNSYLPNQDQIFFNDEVIIEDDVDPRHTSSGNTTDLKVDRYLRDMDLFYSKADTATIGFSRIIASPVQEGKDYPYVKVFFTSTFRGRHSQFDTLYQPTQRVVELRAEKIDGKWRTLITRSGFLRPGEGLTELTKPIISNESGPKQPIRSRETVFLSTGSTLDSIRTKWDQHWLHVVRSSTELLPAGFYQRNSTSGKASQSTISIMLTSKEQRLTFTRIDGSSIVFNDPNGPVRIKRKYQRQGWLQIIAGTAALSASYVGYSSLQHSYDNYASRLTALNSEYAIWQTLTRQGGGNPTTPITFDRYASPGIYAVYGGTVAGGGLIINGIRHLLKAGKIKSQSRK